MVRPHIASAMFVLTREALQPYIRPLDCRGTSPAGPDGLRAVVCLSQYRRSLSCAPVSRSGSHPSRVALFAITFMSLRNAWKLLPPIVCCLVRVVSHALSPVPTHSGCLLHVVGPVVLRLDQQGIGGAGHAIGQRHHRHVLMSPGCDSLHPTAARVRLLVGYP